MKIKIHRFKCSEELNQEIMNFSEIHKFDTDETLLEQFTGWIDTTRIQELVQIEEIYLSRHDYEVPIKTKIFKSIKYYYIKKYLNDNDKSNVNVRTNKVKVKVDPEIMLLIKEDLQLHFETNPNFKPSETYEKFKTLKIDKEDKIDEAPLIKKSYKNQYYQMKHKNKNKNKNKKINI